LGELCAKNEGIFKNFGGIFAIFYREKNERGGAVRLFYMEKSTVRGFFLCAEGAFRQKVRILAA